MAPAELKMPASTGATQACIGFAQTVHSPVVKPEISLPGFA
jgi:hypothetical protein